ncbi:ABC transporter substrate-binding protein [Algihabitans albus]|uniref:ABC transporter substrate-binding protein n=1 Tax=Algihabitans albus TaxID=2164067 RepID=UPI0035CEAA0A
MTFRFVFCFIVALSVTAPAKAEKLTVLLDWFVNPDHAPLIVALDQGYFADEGLEVEFLEPADPNDPPKLVAAGQVPIAISYQPQLHMQAAQGLPVARIATLVATPLNTLVVLADGPIETLADLEGRKIGYSVGGFAEAMLRGMLAPAGVTLADVELINVNFALSASLLSGQVDAVIGAYRNFELNQLEIEGSEGRAFYPEENGVPAYDELVVIANADNLDDPRLAGFVRALERGTIYTINHPEASWEIFKAYKPGLDDELNRRAWWDTLPRFALRPAALDEGRYRRFAEFLIEQEVIDEIPALETYAVELE